MWSPHCWQYAKPTGVAVPQRGHVIVLPPADGRPGGDAFGPAGANDGGAVGGNAVGGNGNGAGVANGPGGAIPGGGAIIGAPTTGASAGEPGVV